jgi:hypothetical protein
VSPAATRPLSTLPLPEGQSRGARLTEVLDHHGDTIVRGRYDGDYDKTNLPDEPILTSYFTVRDGKIVTLIIIRNIPVGY